MRGKTQMMPVDKSAACPIPSALSRARAFLDARYAAVPSKRRLGPWLAACWPGTGGSRNALSAISGQWLQQLIGSSRAQLVVALGTADGTAAVWLADALRSVPGGRSDRALIGFEHSPAAAQHARDVLRRAGVSRYVDIRCDAPVRALTALDAPIDLVLLLDGFDAEATMVLDLLLPKLRSGASLIAPQISRRPVLRACLERHRTADGPLQALRLPIDGGLEWLVKR